MTILEKIIRVKEQEIKEYSQNQPEMACGNKKRASLVEKLRTSTNLQVIAEIKRASPSKGVISEDVDVRQIAGQYERGGAAAISVLTDQTFFKGCFEDLSLVANTVDIPVLCKDFIIHTVQIDIAKQAGASVILLIVAALSETKLTELYQYACKQDLEVLVEVHTVEELQIACQLDAPLIGVNNRNLKSFEVSLSTIEDIAKRFPFHEGRVLISESGVHGKQDAVRAASAGASGVLVGEYLMKSDNKQFILSELQVPKGVGIR